MIHRTIAASVLLLVIAAANSMAAEGPTQANEDEPRGQQVEERSDASTSTSSQTTQDAKPTPKSNTKAAESKEIFRPSEEISEDFAVSFPVDI